MTNEQLVTFIQQDGCSSDLLPVLWDRVKKLCFMLCDRFYYKYADSFTACGCELTDCRQECYFSFLEAVRSFKPAKEYLFTSYLDTWIKNKMRELLGINNHLHLNRKPLDNAVSFDAALPGSEGENEITLHDAIADETAQQPFESLLDNIADERTRTALKQALDKLTDREQQVIMLYFFQGFSLEKIGRTFGVSKGRISQLKASAIRRLRANTKLKLVYCENEAERALHTNNRRSIYEWIDLKDKLAKLKINGEVLTKRQKRRIIINHKTEQACAHDAEYMAYMAIVKAAKNYDGLIPPAYVEQLAAVRYNARLKELQEQGRSLSYGQKQAIMHAERLKAQKQVKSGLDVQPLDI